MSERTEEFYVGYAPRSPAGVARHTRRAVALIGACALLVAFLLAAHHRRLAAAAFEWGEARGFEGIIEEHPYPALFVERPGRTADSRRYSRYHLVHVGKRGAAADVRGLEGHRVGLEGRLVYRDGETMIEIAPGTLIDRGFEPRSVQSLHARLPATLVGEIVDSKCFLGVMSPGELKPHRSCAARCISGGVPPVLCVRGPDGRARYVLLVGAGGEPVNQAVLSFVAEPVEIRGELETAGETQVLFADPSTYRRLP
jgi:hypothetical protein